MHPTPLLPTLFYIVALLPVVPFVNADASHILSRNLQPSHLRDLRFQQRDANNGLPAGWTLIGCYTDSVASPTLASGGYTDTKDMTVKNCVNFCNTRNFFYAGVENGQDCHCGNDISKGDVAPETDCYDTCTGDINQFCGASHRLIMYQNRAASPPVPVIAPKYGPWVSLGCYSDISAMKGMRTLSHRAAVLGGTHDNSVQGCADACLSLGYSLAGVEYGHECYCGNTINSHAAPTPLGDCSMLCTGNSSEFCGGRDRIILYNNTGIAESSPRGSSLLSE